MRSVSCGLRDGPLCTFSPGEVIGVFAHVERAHENGVRRFQALDQSGVARGRRMLAIDLRAGQRRQAGNVEQVLDRERNTRKRAPAQPPCARRASIAAALARARALRRPP